MNPSSNRIPFIEHGLVLDILEMTPTFAGRWALPMVGTSDRFEWFLTPHATCDTPDHLSVFFHRKNSRKCRTCWKSKQLGMVSWIGHTRPWKNWGHFKDIKKTTCSQREPSGNRTPFIEHGLVLDIFEITTTFARRWALPMVGISDTIEWFLTPYASCDTSDHLSVFFHQKNSRKCRICWECKQLGMVPWIGHTRPWKN